MEVDCTSILPYGEQHFPEESLSGELRNYRSLPYPLFLSRCAPAKATGAQTTRDRPFTIAELIMKSNAEEALVECLYPDNECSTLLRFRNVPSTAVSPLGGELTEHGLSGGNCSRLCPTFLECAHTALADVQNRSQSTRHACIATQAGQSCTARTPAVFAPQNYAYRFVTDHATIRANGGWTRSGHAGICFEYECMPCVITQFQRYFDCAVQCSLSPDSIQCTDCSYMYDDSYEDLMTLRERLWEGYYLGAFGDYIVPDLLEANFTSCASEGKGCLSLTRYNMDVLGIGAEPPEVNQEEVGGQSTL